MSDKIVIINQSIRQSIVQDLVTFGCLIGSFFVNYKYLGNSLIIKILISIFFIIVILGWYHRKKELTLKEGQEYINKKLEAK